MQRSNMPHPPHFASQITQAYNVYVNPYGMRRLAPTFIPGGFDVLCARGKLAYDHEGNRRFRALVKQHQKQYSAATCKYEKSKIVSFIVSAVRSATPQGGFVKNIDGQWYEVGDRHAKEKVGQTFRDLLHTKYSSSTKAKARARLQRRIKEDDKADKPKAKREPEPVASRSDDGLRSSVSVVSDTDNGSMDDEDDCDAKTVAKSNTNMPPLTSVIVETKRPVVYAQAPLVSPLQVQRSTNSQLMETLRSSINTFDGRDSQQNRVLQHPGNPHLNPHLSPLPPMVDLEPLPIGIQSLPFGTQPLPFAPDGFNNDELAFDDVMTEFCQNMSVPV